MYGPGLDRKAIAQRALRGLEELSWMSINLYGTRLEVVVREAVESPEIMDDEGFYDVSSEADGIITQVEPLAGEAAVQEGDTVARGEVLISGLISIQPPQYSDQPVRYYPVHARGRVYARTWRTFEAAIPLEARAVIAADRLAGPGETVHRGGAQPLVLALSGLWGGFL